MRTLQVALVGVAALAMLAGTAQAFDTGLIDFENRTIGDALAGEVEPGGAGKSGLNPLSPDVGHWRVSGRRESIICAPFCGVANGATDQGPNGTVGVDGDIEYGGRIVADPSIANDHGNVLAVGCIPGGAACDLPAFGATGLYLVQDGPGDIDETTKNAVNTGLHSVSFDVLLTNATRWAGEFYIGGNNLKHDGTPTGFGHWGRCCDAFEIIGGPQAMSASGNHGLQFNFFGAFAGPGTIRIDDMAAPAVVEAFVWHNIEFRADLDNDLGAVFFDGNLVMGPYPIHPHGGISTFKFGHGADNQPDNVFIDNLRMMPAAAIPEPATMAMLASGLLACLAAHRRLRRRQG